jgi:DNA repair exonuclease SbcCD ATPase subunit
VLQAATPVKTPKKSLEDENLRSSPIPQRRGFWLDIPEVSSADDVRRLLREVEEQRARIASLEHGREEQEKAFEERRQALERRAEELSAEAREAAAREVKAALAERDEARREVGRLERALEKANRHLELLLVRLEEAEADAREAELLQLEAFWSAALACKLRRFEARQPHQLRVQDLYEEVRRLRLPVREWSAFLRDRFDRIAAFANNNPN